MNDVLATYFAGEKGAGAVLAVIGLAMGTGAFFSIRGQPKAFVYTLAVWALLELAIGLGLYFKTDPQLARLAALLANDAASFYAVEQPRMAAVQRNFILLESVWLVLITCSSLVAVWQKSNLTTCGIALGMLINTSMLLAFDIAAERRGSVYVAALNGGPTKAEPDRTR